MPVPNAEVDLIKEANAQKLLFVPSTSPTDTTGFGNFLSVVLEFVMVIGILTVFIFLIWGSLEWITAGGEKAKIESARNKITSSIIGLLVLSGSIAVFFVIQKVFGLNVVTR